MDPFVQRTLEDYFRNDDNFARINNGVQPEASMIVIDYRTGDILGIAGGRGEKTSSRVLNYATQTTRSPGSSIKPVCVYGPALEKGLITYSTVYEDSPVKNKWPSNYPAGYDGPITINRALTVSKNTIAVKVLMDLGFDESYEFAHDKLGMTSIIDEYVTKSGAVLSDLNSSALGLGGMTFGVTLRELTAAYQIFANKGIFNGSRTIIKILDNDGNVIIDNSGTPSIVISEQNASIMTIMMQNVVNYGTATRMTLRKEKVAGQTMDIAGKTGTTSDDKDRWFIGYTPYYLGGVWFGYSIPMALTGFSETASPALMVWDNVMKLLHQPIFDSVENGDEKLETFHRSDGIYPCKVCKKSGLLPTADCGDNTETGYFTQSTMPKEHCTVHKPVETSVTTTKPPETTKDPETTKTEEPTAPPEDQTTPAPGPEPPPDSEKPAENGDETTGDGGGGGEPQPEPSP